MYVIEGRRRHVKICLLSEVFMGNEITFKNVGKCQRHGAEIAGEKKQSVVCLRCGDDFMSYKCIEYKGIECNNASLKSKD